MPRKAFVADLQEAIRDFQCENLSSLAPGEEDGTITFSYHIHGESQGTTIQAIVPGKIFLNMGLIMNFFLSCESGYLREANTMRFRRCWGLPNFP